jgi:Putative lumazine-binding
MRPLARVITIGVVLLPVLGVLPVQPTGAQTPARAVGNDSAAALAVVRALFDAMRAGDSAGVRAAFHPAAQLAAALVRNGRPEVQLDSVAAFARAVGTPHPQVWDERVRRTIVHVDGPLAVVWAEYAFYTGPAFSHCGVDAFQLVKTDAGWRILALTDTRRRAGCPEQAAPRP